MNPFNPSQAPTDTLEKDTVLLVDDERPLLDMYVSALGLLFDIRTAVNSQEAEALIAERPFKVIVADHLMPNGNGIDLMVRTRVTHPQMQRVLITGYMKPDLVLRSVKEAALFRYLLKPFSMSELVTVVHAAARAHDIMLAEAR